MSDFVTRTFRAQLTTSMNSLLSRAVLDIMTIFENSLHDQQVELAQKAEEVAQLKIKLQTAELRLIEGEHASDRGTEMKNSVLKAPEQTCDVPEVDCEVPDDWCAPLGFDTPNKQDDGFCPSVRLRQLSIPLWPITIKTEGDTYDIDFKQRTKSLRRKVRKKGSSSNKRHTAKEQGTPHRPVRNSMRKLLQDIKQELTDQKDGTDHRRSTRNLTGKDEPNEMRSKSQERKTAATEPEEKETEDHEEVYSCRFCDKKCDTMFGLKVHLRLMHKQCKGCKKEFAFPSYLERHKPYCKNLKKKNKKTLSTNLPKPDSCEEETLTAPRRKQGIVEGDSTGSPRNHDSSIQKGRSNKRTRCVRCNKVFRRAWRLREHACVDAAEKRFQCGICSRKFYHNQSLKMHMVKKHQDLTDFSETNHNYMWTKPIEEPEEIAEDLTSPNQDKRQAVDHNSVNRWQTMGTRCPDGFACIFCQRVLKRKQFLIEHFRIHTGERPLKCARCPATFCFQRQLTKHKKKCGKFRKKCDKCGKKFSKLAWHTKHESKCHKDGPN